jgi:hypothetical protein
MIHLKYRKVYGVFLNTQNLAIIFLKIILNIIIEPKGLFHEFIRF